MRRRFVGPALALFVIVMAALPTAAHFLLNLNVRIFHVEHHAEALDVFVRMPMPYLVASRIGPPVKDGLPSPAPYTTNALEDERLVHYVDWAAFDAQSTGLGVLVAEGLELTADTPLQPEVVAVRLHRNDAVPPFATLDEAKAIFADGPDEQRDRSQLYVGDAAVDVWLHYPTGTTVRAYTLSSSLDPDLPGQDDTANLVLDYAGGGVKAFRARGLILEPIAVSRSTIAAFRTFAIEGVRHILEGLDHVLFVVCLVLGARGLRSLIGRVTGFTIGHSITLSAGFFGYVPDGDWFVPTVELGIALSILYAAAVAVIPKAERAGSERTMFLITASIGFLHGLGFSFVLQHILEVTSPDIWQSLLAFNVGVELGQLAIVLVVWTALAGLFWIDERLLQRARLFIAAICAAFAIVWTFSRTAAPLA